jgi:hypothetical protein
VEIGGAFAEGEGRAEKVKRKGEVDDEEEEEDTTRSKRASKRRQLAKPNAGNDEETGLDANEGSRKVKAVKQKKIFLRILRKVMDLPPDSHLVRLLTHGVMHVCSACVRCTALVGWSARRETCVITRRGWALTCVSPRGGLAVACVARSAAGEEVG